jgi:chromosome segregation ATPase
MSKGYIDQRIKKAVLELIDYYIVDDSGKEEPECCDSLRDRMLFNERRELIKDMRSRLKDPAANEPLRELKSWVYLRKHYPHINRRLIEELVEDLEELSDQVEEHETEIVQLQNQVADIISSLGILTVDFNSHLGIFNSHVESFDSHVSDYDAHVSAFQTLVSNYNTHIENYNTLRNDCDLVTACCNDAQGKLVRQRFRRRLRRPSIAV